MARTKCTENCNKQMKYDRLLAYNFWLHLLSNSDTHKVDNFLAGQDVPNAVASKHYELMVLCNVMYGNIRQSCMQTECQDSLQFYEHLDVYQLQMEVVSMALSQRCDCCLVLIFNSMVLNQQSAYTQSYGPQTKPLL